MEFQLSYFKSQKMMLWKCCTQSASKFGKLSSGHRTGKGQFFILIPKKGNAKECSNYLIIALISHTSKVMLKIFQARLQQYVNQEFPDAQAGVRKGRGTRDQIVNIGWIIEKQESSRKTFTSASLTTPKPWTVWITTNCGKFFERWRPPDHLTYLFRNLYAGQEATIRTGHGTTDWFPNRKRSTSRLHIVTLLI